MNKSKGIYLKEYQMCTHSKKDCRQNKRGECHALSCTDFDGKECPFYKTLKDFKDQEYKPN